MICGARATEDNALHWAHTGGRRASLAVLAPYDGAKLSPRFRNLQSHSLSFCRDMGAAL